jgi:hypothetical protein
MIDRVRLPPPVLKKKPKPPLPYTRWPWDWFTIIEAAVVIGPFIIAYCSSPSSH